MGGYDGDVKPCNGPMGQELEDQLNAAMAVGVRNFLAEIYKQSPVDSAHYSFRTPFESVSYFFETDHLPVDARNALLFGSDKRVKSYMNTAYDSNKNNNDGKRWYTDGNVDYNY